MKRTSGRYADQVLLMFLHLDCLVTFHDQCNNNPLRILQNCNNGILFDANTRTHTLYETLFAASMSPVHKKQRNVPDHITDLYRTWIRNLSMNPKMFRRILVLY